MASIGITARYLSGAALATVAVPTHSTIVELKAEIAHIARLEAGVCLQQLIFNGKCLGDDTSLEDAGLTDGSDVVPVCVPIIPIDDEFSDDCSDCPDCGRFCCGCSEISGFEFVDIAMDTGYDWWKQYSSVRRKFAQEPLQIKILELEIALDALEEKNPFLPSTMPWVGMSSAAERAKALAEDIYNDFDDPDPRCDWWNDIDLDRCPSLCGARWAKKALRKTTSFRNQRVDRQSRMDETKMRSFFAAATALGSPSIQDQTTGYKTGCQEETCCISHCRQT
jgi:hypothetical protein